MFRTLYDDEVLLSGAYLTKDSQILDSGVGSGAWITAVAKEIPGIHIEGIDIEDNQFPHPVPENVKLTRMSVQDLPGPWANHFELVHQRGSALGPRREEWHIALSQLYRQPFARPAKIGPANVKQHAILATLCQLKGLVLDVTDHMADMVRTAGFEDIKEDARNIVMSSCNGQLGCDVWTNLYLAFKGLKTPMLKAGGLNHVKSEGEFDQLIDYMGREWEERGGECGYAVVCARKPLD